MKKLVMASLLLALVVIILGAYTRLTDSGLGCPDWPGCYGQLTVPNQLEEVQKAEAAYPERPVEADKAWIEMIHRYFASTLGFFILIIAIVSLKNASMHRPVKLPLFLLVLVIFQGMLGMWTVTMNLLPVVVMGHLLGGFSVASLLFLLWLRLKDFRIPGGDPRIRHYGKLALLGIVILVMQIALGGWTSANYASMACTELPFCEGDWVSQVNLVGAYSIPEASNYEFGVHPYNERLTMHVMHRIGAIVTFVYLAWLGIRLLTKAHSDRIKNQSSLMLLILAVQVSLGIANVVFSLPLAVAVAHNAVAVILLMTLIMLTYSIFRKA